MTTQELLFVSMKTSVNCLRSFSVYRAWKGRLPFKRFFVSRYRADAWGRGGCEWVWLPWPWTGESPESTDLQQGPGHPHPTGQRKHTEGEQGDVFVRGPLVKCSCPINNVDLVKVGKPCDRGELREHCGRWSGALWTAVGDTCVTWSHAVTRCGSRADGTALSQTSKEVVKV